MWRHNKCVSKCFSSAQGKTSKHGGVKKKYIYRFKDFIYLVFSRDLSLRGQGKHNNIKNTEANTVKGSSLVGLVSLIASPVLLLAEAYQRAPFISARIEPLL